MGWNLHPGCTDKDIDDAAGSGREVQCDNCQHMFDPDEDEDCFIGNHRSFGDCCQCGECVRAAKANFPFSGSF
jgi:NAD-dependent SIR2 family protein deacetylase